MAKAWIRTLSVTLTSRKLNKKFVFGDDAGLAIRVNGYKYLSTLKDTCTIEIDNLTYDQIVRIIENEYYDVEVKAGYREANSMSFFKGAVLYITNRLNFDKTNTLVILCASELVARYGQKRLNLSLKSSINMYAALQFICRQAGIPANKLNISKELASKLINTANTVDGTVASWIDNLCNESTSLVSNSDGITGIVSVFDLSKQTRKIRLNEQTINLTQGYPQLTSEGLKIYLMPTFAFQCGDTIQIDNSIINLSTDPSGQSNLGYYLDKDGCYFIFEQSYRLENRGDSFDLCLTCKSRSLIKNIQGG